MLKTLVDAHPSVENPRAEGSSQATLRWIAVAEQLKEGGRRGSRQGPDARQDLLLVEFSHQENKKDHVRRL